MNLSTNKHKKTYSARVNFLVLPFLYFTLFLFCFPSYAQYINTYTDGKLKAWIDPSSKEGSGNIRRIMELVNYKDKQVPKPGFEYQSIIYQYQFDCSKRTFKVLMSVAFEKHQGQGRLIFRDDTATPNYMGIKDGSSVYEALTIACR